ncbi:MAG: efflux RND transporter periplasmic adaptor subunit [Pseudolabrys sp.]
MSFRRQWIAVALVLLLLAAGAVLWRTMRPIAVLTAAPQANVEVRVFGIGTVEAQVLSKVGFQIAGKVVAVAADQGDRVAAGAVLARLDDAAQRAKVLKTQAAERQAAANLARAEAQQNRAEVSFRQKKVVSERRQTLAGRGAVSQEQADDAQTAEELAAGDVKVAAADARVAAALRDDAAAQLQIENVVLAQHELRAPFEARVIARHKELGGVANAGEAVFTLIAPQSIWVRAHIDEALAGGLQVGQTALVRLRSQPERTVEAEVVRIDQENDRLTEERRVYVRCRGCDPQHQLRVLGEQAEVEIVKTVIASGIFVPLKAVEGYDGRAGAVWLLENGRLARRQVQFGERLLDGRLQLASPLPAGAALVIDPRTDLREGRAAYAAQSGGR